MSTPIICTLVGVVIYLAVLCLLFELSDKDVQVPIFSDVYGEGLLEVATFMMWPIVATVIGVIWLVEKSRAGIQVIEEYHEFTRTLR